MVEILETVLVAPAEETPKHSIWLSNLDLFAARGYTPTIYVYRSDGLDSGYFSPEAFKTALAKALVPFYFMAGRLGTDEATGRVQIDCTGEGATFVLARSEWTADDFKDFSPSAEARKEFVPAVESADPPCVMTTIQATKLKCGGLVIGFANHHYSFDGQGAMFFVKAISNFSRIGAAEIPDLVLDRTLLRAHSPPDVKFDHKEIGIMSEIFRNSVPASDVSVTANLRLSKDQVHALKILAGGERVSTFRAISAHIWRCACVARGLASDLDTHLFLPVDVRARLDPPLPATFMGNTAFRTLAVAKVEDLTREPLGFGAGKIQAAVNGVTTEYVRSLIDYLETMDLSGQGNRGTLPVTSLCIVSWLGMPTNDADFGWGQPELMARAHMYGSGFVYLMKSSEGDGGVTVVLGLEADSMRLFRKIFYDDIAVHS